MYFSKRLATYNLHSGWSGPFVVVRQLNATTFEIQKSPSDKVWSVHCDNLTLDPWRPNRPNWIRARNAESETVRLKNQENGRKPNTEQSQSESDIDTSSRSDSDDALSDKEAASEPEVPTLRRSTRKKWKTKRLIDEIGNVYETQLE